MFPRLPGPLQAIVINSAGGITGGDRLRLQAEAGEGAHLVLTTQAAERAYRANGATPGRIDTRLAVAAGARSYNFV